MPNSLDDHKLPDQLPVKGHDNQFVIPYPLGGTLHTNYDMPIQYQEGKLDHYSDAEKKNFIAGAIKHPGALTKKAHKAGESPMAFAAAHKGDPGTTGKQARLALTLRKLAHHKKG